MIEAKYKISLTDHTKKAFKAIGRGLNKTRKAVFSLKTGFVSAAGITGLGFLIKRSLDATDKLGKVSSKLGVTSEELQRFRYAARLAGVEQRTLDMGLQRFTRRVGEAAQGTGEAKQALKDMGIELKSSNGRILSATSLLSQVADALKNTTDPAERLRLAFKLFDSEGVAMVNMLKDGSKAFKDTIKEADTLGMVLSNEAVQGVEAANNAIFRLSNFITTVFHQVVAKLAPLIETLSDKFREWTAGMVKNGGGIKKVSQSIARSIINMAIKIIEAFVSMGNGLIDFNNKLHSILPTWAGGLRPVDEVLKDIEKTKERLNKPFFGRSGASIEKRLKKELEELNKELGLVKTRTISARFNMDNFIDSLKSAIPEIEKLTKETEDLFTLTMPTEKTIWDHMTDGFLKYKKTVTNGSLTIASITEAAMKKTEDAIVDMLMGIKSDFKAMARSIMADVIRMQVRENITKPLSNMFSNLFKPNSGNFMVDGIGVSGFAGGGFTGSGARSGGIDGQGGFAAILHPNETVIDHTRGGGANATTINVTYSPQINALDPRTAASVIAQNAQTIVGVIRQAFNRNGQAVAL